MFASLYRTAASRHQRPFAPTKRGTIEREGRPTPRALSRSFRYQAGLTWKSLAMLLESSSFVNTLSAPIAPI